MAATTFALCRWLHEQLEVLPLVAYPFDLRALPDNGVYFFYEEGEAWGHGGSTPRIVRVGTHRDGNFRSRIGEHYGISRSATAWDLDRPTPHDRSIFRKNIGRALLNATGDPYLAVWDIDFTSKANRSEYRHRRDLETERRVEQEVTRRLRRNFGFRFLILNDQARRMGGSGLESALIGTLSRCGQCRPSPAWIGNRSPRKEIRESGLWLVQHLQAPPITDADQRAVVEAAESTTRWLSCPRRTG
jgi:hypothetical protein